VGVNLNGLIAAAGVHFFCLHKRNRTKEKCTQHYCYFSKTSLFHGAGKNSLTLTCFIRKINLFLRPIKMGSNTYLFRALIFFSKVSDNTPSSRHIAAKIQVYLWMKWSSVWALASFRPCHKWICILESRWYWVPFFGSFFWARKKWTPSGEHHASKEKPNYLMLST